MNYPVFGRSAQPVPRLSFERPKKRDRELGHKWSVAAAGYLKRNPWCAECRRRGRDVLAVLVDHIVPRKRGGAMWDRKNFQGLCRHCDLSVKRHLEAMADEIGNPAILAEWMARPETRPGRWAFVAIAEADI